jgi:hypothetical protein
MEIEHTMNQNMIIPLKNNLYYINNLSKYFEFYLTKLISLNLLKQL